jgi:hypothetical protein
MYGKETAMKLDSDQVIQGVEVVFGFLESLEKFDEKSSLYEGIQ